MGTWGLELHYQEEPCFMCWEQKNPGVSPKRYVFQLIIRIPLPLSLSFFPALYHKFVYNKQPTVSQQIPRGFST
jgi:hypothetical protein